MLQSGVAGGKDARGMLQNGGCKRKGGKVDVAEW
jgi:hypothetical protein